MDSLFLEGFRQKPKAITDMQARAYDVLDQVGMRKVPFGGTRIVEILRRFGIKTYLSNIEPQELSAYIVINPTLMAKFGTSRVACVICLYGPSDCYFNCIYDLWIHDDTKHHRQVSL